MFYQTGRAQINKLWRLFHFQAYEQFQILNFQLILQKQS